MKPLILRLAAALLAVGILSAPAATAADAPGKPLVEWLPQNTAAYLRVTDLEGFWNRLLNSPIRQQFESLPIPDLARTLADAHANLDQVKQQTGIDVVDVVKGLVGTDFAVALFPDGEGAFISKGRPAEDILGPVRTFIAVQEGEGEIAGEQIETYQGVDIHTQQVLEKKAPGKPPTSRSYAVTENTLIVSKSVDTVKKVIDAGQGRTPRIGASAEFKAAQPLMKPASLAVVYADLGALRQSALFDKALAPILRNPLAQMWRERVRQDLADGRCLVMNLATDDATWTLNSTMLFAPGATPAAVRDIMPPAGSPLSIARFVPVNAVASFGNQCNKAALWTRVSGALQEANPIVHDQANMAMQQLAAMFGMADFEKEFLPQLGPQAALFALPGDPNAPPSVVLAVELANGPALPQTLKTWVGTLATMSQMEAQKKQVTPQFSVTRAMHQGVEITTLQIHRGALAGKIAPSLCVSDKAMFIATSDSALRQTLDAGRAAAQGIGASPKDGVLFSLAHLNFDALAALLRTHQGFLVQEAVKKGKTAEQAQTDLRNIDALLSLVKNLSFDATYRPGRMDRTLTLNLAQP